MISITDIPITRLDQDLLKINKYAIALSNFIQSSETPITVGLQGEWGTGKTSLMSILSEQLSEQNIATSWVNTWEYSLFRGARETTPAVLQGMLEKLEQSCRARGNWDIGDEASKKVKQVGRFLSGVANQLIAAKTGIDIATAADCNTGRDPAGISAIKADIASIIQKLIDSPGNPYKKVVFFVDDLDRIPPNDAVEVLEALKNIFDMPKCVFVLAIDYEVVVKGLESKFGPKTERNEREFRSFFDKIIQVPFSMPVGTYTIENFLLDKFGGMGYQVTADEAEDYAKVVRLTIGTNPRSLKRYLNSYSLINHVKQIEEQYESSESSLMLFTLLGIQISYPYLFRMLTKEPDYTSWNATFTSKEDINFEAMKEKMSLYKETKYLDEEWEQILWCLCQRDTYLKSKAFDAIRLLNFLREKYGSSLNDDMIRALEFAAITSVDDDAGVKQAVIKGHKILYASLELKLAQMKEGDLNEKGIEAFRSLMAYPSERAQGNPKYRVSFAKTGSAFYNDSAASMGEKQLLYVCNPGKRKFGIKFYLKGNSGVKDEIQDYLLELLGISHIDETNLISESFLETNKLTLIVEPDLCGVLGEEKYYEILSHISKRICDVHDDTYVNQSL